jgi:hypothetical protein
MRNFTIEQILEAIKNSAGLMTIIAKKLDCEWHIAKKYVLMFDETKQALQDEIEKTKDLAEKVVFDAINNKDVQVAKWYLQTIGKDRGYSDNLNLNVECDLLKSLLENIKNIK